MLARLGARITELRKQRGNVSISDVAKRAGVNPSYLGEVERGQANISLIALHRVAGALKVGLGEFFPVVDETDPTAVFDAQPIESPADPAVEGDANQR